MITLVRIERIWDEVIVAYIKTLSQYLPLGTHRNHDISVRIIGIRAKIQTRHLQDTRQKRYISSQLGITRSLDFVHRPAF
jgi:hypothetical protein